MTTQTAVSTPSRTCTPAQRVTRSLLGYGVLAGTVFEVSILIQGLTRHGFRLAHHDASLLGNGPLGWIQIATFVVSGAMTIACAVGMRRALAGRAGGTWGHARHRRAAAQRGRRPGQPDRRHGDGDRRPVHRIQGAHQLRAVRGQVEGGGRRVGRLEEAREEFGRAAALTGNERERALFRARADACVIAVPGSG